MSYQKFVPKKIIREENKRHFQINKKYLAENQMEGGHKTPLNIAYCYASEDEALRYELDKHLSILKHQGLIITWHNSEILAGSEFRLEKETQLDKANIILLLISSDF